MASVKQRDLPLDQKAREIVKVLAELTYNHSNDQVFSDWLDAVDHALAYLPVMSAALSAGQPIPEDTPEATDDWKRIKARYGDKAQPVMAQAFALLLDASEDGEEPTYQDILGPIYMAFAYPNSHTGQFFTPQELCRAMAQMIIGDGESEVLERIADAYLRSPHGSMHALLTSADRASAWVKQQGMDAVLYWGAHFQPITVSDPCVGAGTMLLEAAARYPRWAITAGLVQFYGQDIDHTCYRMARINTMLYGMNGYGLKCSLSMSETEVAALPEPYQSATVEAQAAAEAGDTERVAEIAQEVRQGTYQQISMFEMA